VRQNCPFRKLLYGILAVNFIPFDSNSLHGTVCQPEKLPGTASWLNVYLVVMALEGEFAWKQGL
jgi:hypothetical protein